MEKYCKMKEKILRKEVLKVESEIIIDQETICANINNLSSALSSLGEIDPALLPNSERFEETKVNILDALYILSTHLTTEEPI